MANTIGSIQIEVLANIASMVSDLGKANQESTRAAREFQQHWQSSIDTVKAKFVELGAAIGIGFSIEKAVEFGKVAVDNAEKVRNLSIQLGASTQSIQAIGFAAALTGGSLDTVSTSLTKLERSAVQAQSGNKQMEEGFRALGVSVTDSSGKLKSADALFQGKDYDGAVKTVTSFLEQWPLPECQSD